MDLLNTLKTGRESLQEIAYLKGINILYNMIPIKLDNKEVIGAIATFNDIDTITKGEHKIRNKVLNKGLYATYKFHNIKGRSRSIGSCISIAEVCQHKLHSINHRRNRSREGTIRSKYT